MQGMEKQGFKMQALLMQSIICPFSAIQQENNESYLHY